MAAIIQEDKRLTALSQIESNLNVLKSTNLALSGKEPFTILTTFKNKACKVPLGEKESKKVFSVLLSQRERLVKETKSLAQKNKIAFDNADLEILKGPDGLKAVTSQEDKDSENTESDTESIESVTEPVESEPESPDDVSEESNENYEDESESFEEDSDGGFSDDEDSEDEQEAYGENSGNLFDMSNSYGY